jgi:hypothetical protein
VDSGCLGNSSCDNYLSVLEKRTFKLGHRQILTLFGLLPIFDHMEENPNIQLTFKRPHKSITPLPDMDWMTLVARRGP